MITRLFKKIYKFIDQKIVVPISRFIYYLSKKFKKNQGKLDKLLNRPHFLIYLSLFLAVIMFLLIDSKVINLVKTEAEEIRGVPVVVKYNEEAYVIEGVPETVDITLTGRKSDIYLAKQLGEYEVVLDLSEYTPSDNPYKVYFSYSKPIHSLTYKLDPSYVQVIIKNKESQVKTLSYDLLNINALDSRLSVKSVSLNKTEVVVKGGSDALAEIASVKALIDLAKQNFSEAGTYDIDNVELVAYDSKGNKLTNVEIVPSTISASVILESYSKAVPIRIENKDNKNETCTGTNCKDNNKTCENNNCDKTTGSLDSIIYPLYIPTNTHLKSSETVSTASGERVILTFSGDKNFVIVEETSKFSSEFEVIPVFGDPLMLDKTIAALSSNSISWNADNVSYYLVSSDLSSNEMVNVAKSLGNSKTVISTK